MGLSCAGEDQQVLFSRTESGEGLDHEKRQGKRQHTGSAPATHAQAKGTPPISVLFKEKKSKSLLNIRASGGLSLPLLSYSLRQALCHSSVPRGDTVACTPLCVRTS